jgi:hypothetical protein
MGLPGSRWEGGEIMCLILIDLFVFVLLFLSLVLADFARGKISDSILVGVLYQWVVSYPRDYEMLDSLVAAARVFQGLFFSGHLFYSSRTVF